MKINQIKEQCFALDKAVQAQIKGGTDTTNSIIIEDIDGI